LVDLVVAQVVRNRHLLDARLETLQLERGGIEAQIQRQRRARAPGIQRVGLHHGIGQHGDFVPRHIDRGQALARHLVERAAGLDRQPRCRDVDAQRDLGAAQALQAQGVVDLGGVRVVDRKRLHRRQRQALGQRRQGRQRPKTHALGELVEQKALPMKFVGVADGAGALQQQQRGGVGAARGVHHGLVLGRVFIGPKQNLVELLGHRRRAQARSQIGCPGLGLGLNLLFLLDRRQRLLHHLGRGFFVAAFAGAPKVVRGLALGPQRLGRLQQRRRLGLRKAQQHQGGLDLDALARFKLDLQRGIGFGQDAAGEQLAGFVKQGVQNGAFWAGRG